VITRIQENENYGFPKQSQQAEDKWVGKSLAIKLCVAGMKSLVWQALQVQANMVMTDLWVCRVQTQPIFQQMCHWFFVKT
jgi:hypothetical protein